MPSLPAYVTAHAGDAQQCVPLLVELLTGTPFRWTTFDRPIYANSHMWTNAAIKVEGLSLNSYDATECQLTLGDQSDVLAALDLSTTKGISGTVVNIWECWLNPVTFAVEATVKKFRGRIALVSIAKDAVKLSIGPYVNLARKPLPRWTVSANCPYTFKDGRCGYGGADVTCLKTWDDCGARNGGSNQVRFGGFRNLPPDGTKIVWKNGDWVLGSSQRTWSGGSRPPNAPPPRSTRGRR